MFCLADRLTDDVSAELCAQSKLFKKQAGSKTGKQQKDLFQVTIR